MRIQETLGLLTFILIILTQIILIDFTIYNVFLSVLITFILINLIKGSEHSFFYILTGGLVCKPKIIFKGFVKPGYENVKKEFEKNFYQGMERGAQCTAYVKGEIVVNLHGSFETDNYDNSTLQRVFSTSKSVTAIVIAMLVDRNLLDYQEKVVKYWPEFGQNGKENIKICDIMRHESGLQVLDEVTKQDVFRFQIKKNAIGQKIEKSKQNFDKASVRSYHAASRGFILNEIVRRVDPKKRTVGEFIEEEIRKPLNLDFYVGVPELKLNQIQDVKMGLFENRIWSYLQSFVPKFVSEKSLSNFIIVFFTDIFFSSEMRKPTMVQFNSVEAKLGEAPSVNGYSNAESLAKIANLVVNKGKLGDVQLFSEKTFEKMHQDPILRLDSLFRMETKFTQGGFNIYDKEQQLQTQYEAEGFIGWQGMGGSIMQWHNKEQIAYGYAMSLMDSDFKNGRAFRLKKELWNSVQNLKKNK